MSFALKANAEDNPTWEHKINGPDRDGYFTAAEEELETLEKKDAWELVSMSDWMQVLPSSGVLDAIEFQMEVYTS